MGDGYNCTGMHVVVFVFVTALTMYWLIVYPHCDNEQFEDCVYLDVVNLPIVFTNGRRWVELRNALLVG